MREENVKGRRIAIIGGGMTAASLALAACDKGVAKVALVTPSRLKVQESVCDPGWFGSKHLHGFRQIHSWQVMSCTASSLISAEQSDERVDND